MGRTPAELDIIDYWNVAWSRKKVIVAITALAFLLSITISLVIKPKFASSVSILPPQPESSLGDGLAQVQSIVGGGILPLGSPVDLWIGIIDSNNLKMAIIKRFGLIERYGVDSIDDAIKALDGNISVHKSKEGIIRISIEDRDPRMAADMANAVAEELDRINRDLIMTSGKSTRVFIEKRLEEAKRDLDTAENNLRRFQEANRAIKLDEQSRTIIEAISSLKGQIIAKKLELETLLSYSTQSNPQVSAVKAQLRELEKQMNGLLNGKGGEADIFIPTSSIPKLSADYAKLLRDSKVLSYVFEFLNQQYVMAKITEAKDNPTVQVLDKAFPPAKRFKPKRAKIVILGTMAGFFVSIFGVFFLEFFNGVMQRRRAAGLFREAKEI